MTIKPILILFLTSLLVATGCTVVHTVPLAGRLGDTIFVAVGSPDDEITAGNTDLTYTPAGGSPIAIDDSAIISIFNLYPDPVSSAWLYSAAKNSENTAGHTPYTTIMAVSLPNNGSLSAGTGSLQVNTTATFTAPTPSPNGFNIALEILPGTGQASSFDYLGFGQFVLAGNLAELEPLPRLRFTPAFTGYDDTNIYGAVEIKIAVDKTGINESDFNIIVAPKIGPTQSRNVHAGWRAQRFETTVYFISPTGKMQYSDVDFSIVSTDLMDPGNGYILPTNADISTTWYDIDGNEVAGPAVTVVNL